MVKHYDAPYTEATTPETLRSVPAHATHVLVGAVEMPSKKASTSGNATAPVQDPKKKKQQQQPQQGEDEDKKIVSKFGDLPSVIALAAIGERDAVLRNTSSHEKARKHNGAYWYFMEGNSFGFSPTSRVSLYDADTVDSRGTSGEHKGHLRLCWLTNGGDGYRAGRVNGRDNTRHWRKVIFYRSNGHVKPLPAFSARTLVLLGLPNVLSGAKAQRFSAEALAGGYDEDDEDDSDGDGDDDDNDDDADDECVLVASACLTSVLRHVMDDAGESLVRTALLERKDSVRRGRQCGDRFGKTALEHFGQRVGVSLTLRATHVRPPSACWRTTPTPRWSRRPEW